MRTLIIALALFSSHLAFAGKVETLLFDSNLIPDPRSKEAVFIQRLDHHNQNDSRTFKQRYWDSTGYTKGARPPVILYVCGESRCGSGAAMGPLSVPARKVGARMFMLEHRYYGDSQPFAELTTENLKYLSTEQALRDLVAFKQAMVSKFGLSGPWVIVGGSYAGNLAAYARTRYPQEFAGALASSAPLWAKADFKEYDRKVAEWAGASCVSALNTALDEIEREITSEEGFKSLQARFDANTVHRRDDFLYLLSDITSASIQSPFRSEFCQKLQTEGVSGFVEMKKKIDKEYGRYSDYTAEEAEDVSVAKHSKSLGMRQWFYQSCTEYGFWQNAWPLRNESARSREIDEDYHHELCRRLFGLPGFSETDSLLKIFSEPVIQAASRILFTTGTADPWHALTIGMRVAENGHLQALTSPDAGHCSDLQPGGSPSVQAAKKRFQELVEEWVSQPSALAL